MLRAPVGLGDSDSGRRWSLWKWLASQGGSRVVPVWFQVGPWWFQGGSRVVPGWLVPGWFQGGSRVVPSGSQVVPGWSQVGFRVVPGWRVSREIQAAPGDSRVVPGWFQAGSCPGQTFHMIHSLWLGEQMRISHPAFSLGSLNEVSIGLGDTWLGRHGNPLRWLWMLGVANGRLIGRF